MKLHLRKQPSGSCGVYDEGGHMLVSFGGDPAHAEARALGYISGYQHGERAAKIDRSQAVDRAHKLLDELR